MPAKLLELKNFKRMKKQTNELKKVSANKYVHSLRVGIPYELTEKTPVRAGVAGERNGAKISPALPPIPRK